MRYLIMGFLCINKLLASYLVSEITQEKLNAYLKKHREHIRRAQASDKKYIEDYKMFRSRKKIKNSTK